MKKIICDIAIIAVLISGLTLTVLADSTKQAEAAKVWQVIGGGGDVAVSTDYQLTGTIGQSSVGLIGAASLKLNSGFWQNFDDSIPCNCTPGDANFDEIFNIFDILFIIGYLYEGGPPPIPEIICSSDPTIDCLVNIFDIVYLIRYLFLEGQPPPGCEEWYNTCAEK